jgi:hypothetical protein
MTAPQFAGRVVSRRLLSATAVALFAMACTTNGFHPTDAGDPMPSLDRGEALKWQAGPTIVQSLRLLNPGLHEGDTLKLESVLKNVGGTAVTIEHVNCELDIQGNLQLHAPLIYCFAYSSGATLAPGQQVVGHLQRVVASPPGRYTIEVKHLLTPPAWVPAELTILPK